MESDQPRGNLPSANKKAEEYLTPRRDPVQQRSRQRAQQIIDVTGELLERVGFDDLNTTLIAKEVGISVGTLYHYFPNKHAILYAMGLRWLDGIEAILGQIDKWPLEELLLEDAVDRLITLNFKVYKKQKAILTLVQAMFSVPELRELDMQHDELIISRMALVFKRLGIHKHITERERLARFYLEMTHSLFLVLVNQTGERAKRTLSDLKLMAYTLLAQHHKELVDLPTRFPWDT
ncbi:TetR/AcrR family transcriptional regulator [Motiliproteus sp. MSK22-1]|uniref:TetR/AcrR family transcriptional regulator n=1 Tax=Motiliproteus sp. MSK22-1 TaxID=1897630 RepID=UPI000975DFE2|nr:TetR/AcrR family transcriptional regulator [Motiliproteus sp. MSK22-1]OMH38905.1 transcriptional regulator [Motiliproteus sp. MSK22-1]